MKKQTCLGLPTDRPLLLRQRKKLEFSRKEMQTLAPVRFKEPLHPIPASALQKFLDLTRLSPLDSPCHPPTERTFYTPVFDYASFGPTLGMGDQYSQ